MIGHLVHLNWLSSDLILKNKRKICEVGSLIAL